VIGLRVAHLIPVLRPSSAVGGCLALARWLRSNHHDSLIVTTGGLMLDGVREEGHEVLTYEDSGGGLLGRHRRKLVQRLTEWEPDLLHAHRLDAVPQATALAERLGLSVVASIHAPHKGKVVEALKHERVRLVLVPSEAIRAHCCGRLGLHPDQVAVLPYGVDASRFRAQPLHRDGPLTIGMVGNVDDEGAGFQELIDALKLLRAEDVPFRARLLGRGQELQRLRRDAEAAGISDSVMVAEAGLRLAPAFGDLAAFVYPVHRDLNILCLAKAMAASCAVVASAVGGVPELVHDGHNGILVPPADPAALAAALRRLAEQPELVSELGREARATIEQDCDLELVGSALEELYRCALRGGSAAKTGTEVVNTWRRVSGRTGGEGEAVDGVA